MIDFASLPPEITSTLIYTGPGAAPMMAAAVAWSSLGVELHTTASTYESVVTTLTTEAWRGAGSAAMAAAIAPHVAWMYTTAAAAERAAGQATASAAAYEQAFAMTVPPPLVLANRIQLAALVATNILGQNTMAIAACEAHYSAMWAQDTAAMYAYAATSAAAAMLNPLTPPTSPVNPLALAAQGVTATNAGLADSGSQLGLSQLVTALPTAMQGLTQPLTGSSGGLGLDTVLSDMIHSTGGVGAWNAMQSITGAGGNIGAWWLFGGIAAGINGAPTVPAALSSTTKTAGSSGVVLADSTTDADFAAPPTSASLGEAYEVDGLSVPPAWSTAVPAEPDAVTLADAAAPAATAGGFSIPGGGYGLAAAGGALAPLAMRARQPAGAPSTSMLARSRARKRRAARRRAQPKSDA